jgi:cystathionine gamma-synthase
MELARRLSTHPAVEKVRFPGLESDPFHERAKAQLSGFGAIISIEVKGGAHVAQKACESSRLVTFATSLGGVETLWERRHRWGTESPEIPTNLIRIAVGIEDVEDLWRDLDQALSISQK